MKFRLIISLIILVIIVVICSLVIINQNGYMINNINNSSSNTPSLTITDSPASTEQNNILIVPTNDYVINHINWSLYPNLETGYVYTVYIAEPTNVVPHKFIEVQILTEVKGTENRTIIRNQLSGVAQEARKIYGQNSSINIHGTKGGASAWIVSLLPYDDTIY